jgi:flagellar basal body-associated protein FliL
MRKRAVSNRPCGTLRPPRDRFKVAGGTAIGLSSIMKLWGGGKTLRLCNPLLYFHKYSKGENEMRVLLVIATVFFMSFSSTFCFAQSKEEIAGKIMQADREVREYQTAKANGSYVDYSVTPTWVTVIYSVVGIGMAGLFVVFCFLVLTDKTKKGASLKETDALLKAELETITKNISESHAKVVAEAQGHIAERLKKLRQEVTEHDVEEREIIKKLDANEIHYASLLQETIALDPTKQEKEKRQNTYEREISAAELRFQLTTCHLGKSNCIREIEQLEAGFDGNETSEVRRARKQLEVDERQRAETEAINKRCDDKLAALAVLNPNQRGSRKRSIIKEKAYQRQRDRRADAYRRIDGVSV